MIFFGLALMILFLLAYCRKRHHGYHSLKFKYKLYELRDRLRMLAIQEKVDPNTWIFEYYDSTLSKSISQHSIITIYMLALLSARHARYEDGSMEQNNKLIQTETKRNPELVKIHNEYIEAIKIFLKEQHFVSVNFIIKPIIVPIIGTAVIAKKFNEIATKILVLPETSHSGQLA